MKYIFKLGTILILLAAAFAGDSPAAAHTYHTSLTRIDFNKEAKSLEIEINLFNHDLEKVLEAKNRKNIDIDKTENIDDLLLEYLNAVFAVERAGAGSTLKLSWVGKEVKVDLTTLFVEIKNVESAEDLRLRNRIFFESFPEQVNLVTVHLEDKKFDLMFKPGDDFKNFVAGRGPKT